MNWESKYDSVGNFSEGRAWVRLNRKCGFVDEHGNVVIPLKYDNVGIFRNGRASIRFGECWGKVDLDGNEYFSPQDRAKLRQLKIQRLLKDL
jgi:hypothetical protein